MGKYTQLAALAGFAATVLLSSGGNGQTPEQQKSWDAERARAAADAKAAAERLARERAARKADPMAWVRTLDPMSTGGWEFRTVANDGSWATFSSTHQMQRSGQVVTVWLRQEYAEPQVGSSGPFLSVVEKAQYDCKKQQERALLVIYYVANNIQGSAQTEESDGKNTPWSAIVPGTREEFNFLWACAPTTRQR
ncbi:MAG: surface-adhesin E family protein [Steroidobacteraceae bacterium]